MRKLKLDELNRPDLETFQRQDKFPVVLVLDNIRSALNVGSLFRTADAFALEAVCLVGITAQPPHKEILKTALGSTQSVKWMYFETPGSCIAHLKEQNYLICSLEQTTDSQNLAHFEPSKNQPYALVLGNEVDGVHNEFLTHSFAVLEIEQYGTKHSINVAVCGGIAAWHFVLHIH